MSATTRRSALRGASLVGLLGVSVAAIAARPAAAHPDAELIAACEEAIRQDGIKDAVNRGEFGDDNEDAEDAAHEAWWAAFERVEEEIPATTKEGVRAKARVLRLAVRDNVCSCVDWTIASHGELHERMADALCNDILALEGAA